MWTVPEDAQPRFGISSMNELSSLSDLPAFFFLRYSVGLAQVHHPVSLDELGPFFNVAPQDREDRILSNIMIILSIRADVCTGTFSPLGGFGRAAKGAVSGERVGWTRRDVIRSRFICPRIVRSLLRPSSVDS